MTDEKTSTQNERINTALMAAYDRLLDAGYEGRDLEHGITLVLRALERSRGAVRRLKRQLRETEQVALRTSFRRYALEAVRHGHDADAAAAMAGKLTAAEHNWIGDGYGNLDDEDDDEP